MQPVNSSTRALALKSNLQKRKQLKASKSSKTLASVSSLVQTATTQSLQTPNQATSTEKIVTQGGNPLNGSITIMGAKNSALPIICACILANKPVTLLNVPALSDVKVILQILQGLNCNTKVLPNNSVYIEPNVNNNTVANPSLCATMRASVLVLAPLLAKYNTATVTMPGGCSIGSRPIDLHIMALEKMGATIQVKNNTVFATAPNGLHGAEITFPLISVGATENTIMAAVYATGVTTINNCALEPEITDLCNFLISIGANIKGVGTSTLIINGNKNLLGGQYSIIADRIEAASYIALALATKGKITLNNVSESIFGNMLQYFNNMGGSVKFINPATIVAEYTKPLQAINITTAPFPDFPTDIQSQFMVLQALANGVSTVNETIFEDRFKHVAELQKIGANISINKSVATITGVANFSNSAQLVATDLRASFTLIIAALCNTNTCSIINLEYLDRGYLNVVQNLKSLGANINRGVNL